MMARRLGKRALVPVLALVALGLGVSESRAADDAADFYTGKRITVVIGYGVGGGYDLYARTVARHMGRYISGNPTFIVQNMPGAGSRKAANWLYNVAPKDGTVLAAVGENTPLDQALGDEGIAFDAVKFNWIGNANVDNNILFARADSGFQTIHDVQKKGGLVCGGTGATSPSILNPQLLNNMMDAKIRIISGYSGSGDVNIALERNEINCRGSNTWASTKATQPQALRDRTITILVQFGPKKDPTISEYQRREVPLITELATNDEDRTALKLIVSGVSMGRSLVAPPGVPPMRVDSLRRAFDATMKDPKFLADAEKLKMDVNPLSGEDIQQIARETVNAPASAVRRANALLERRHVEDVKR